MRASVVVVGAGSAGLATAAALSRRGVATVVLERGAGVGTSWRARHEDLRLNTVRWLSTLPGGRIPRTAGRWVTRDEYIRHLEDFAARQRLTIRPGARVDRLDRAAGGWRVRSSAGDLEAAHVVVATGREHRPHMPGWPGRETFTPRLLHAAELTRVGDLAGREVLLVGAGNSGIELAEHLVDSGVTRLWVSVRTPPTILPLEVGGIPLDALGVASRYLPERFRDWSALRQSRDSFGDLEPYGLPAPAQGPYARLRTTGVTVAVDRGFVGHLRAGRLEVVPEVRALAGPEVELVDGRRLRPDVVVTATGYRPALDELVGDLGVLTPAGLPASRPGRPVPGAPGLWFVGYWPALDGDLRRHPIEARTIARRIAASLRQDGSGARRP
jgi:cation diffusion facilitator CzcD-associated flavoprotein CzcO